MTEKIEKNRCFSCGRIALSSYIDDEGVSHYRCSCNRRWFI